MSIFSHKEFDQHEQVIFCYDDKTGLKAIIAVHSTTLGPALGGCRLWNYQSDTEALTDVLRLSKGMTYKAAVAGLNLGGGKSVIIGDAKKVKSEALFRAFGRFVDSLGGKYLTAEDVNIKVEDMEHIAKETKYQTGASTGSGDPSPMTALGVFHGIRASIKEKYDKEDLDGVKVAIQGCGNVGSYLAKHLHESGAQLFVSDIDPEKAKKLQTDFGANISPLEEIHSLDVDVYSPCALGGGLNDKTIPEIKAKVIAGGANNQLLQEAQHADMISKNNILYAPDYVINSGGIINCYREIAGYDKKAAEIKTAGIYDTLLEVYSLSKTQNISTVQAANEVAKDRLKNHGER